MISCREVVALLIDFVADELPPHESAVVEEHLRACPPCAIYLATYRQTITLCRRLPCRPLPDELVLRLKTALLAIQSGGAGAGSSWGP